MNAVVRERWGAGGAVTGERAAASGSGARARGAAGGHGAGRAGGSACRTVSWDTARVSATYRRCRAAGFGAGDARGLDHDDVIEFKTFGQRHRHQREARVRTGRAVLDARAIEHARQGPDLRVGGDHGDRPGLGAGLGAGRHQGRAEPGGRDPDDLQRPGIGPQR